jgi:hypothetical protein
MINQIKNQKDLEVFIQYLIDNDQLFHFDDEPADIINYETNEAAFTTEQCKLLTKRIDEICELNLLEKAFELALNYIEENS